MINLKEFNVDSELQSIADAITVNGLQFCGGVFDHMPTGEEFVLTIASDSRIKRISDHNDRLVEENTQQRESLDAFRELVKAQTKTMNELNEKCKKQSKLIKELTYESNGKWYSGLHGDSDITDIVGDLLD